MFGMGTGGSSLLSPPDMFEDVANAHSVRSYSLQRFALPQTIAKILRIWHIAVCLTSYDTKFCFAKLTPSKLNKVYTTISWTISILTSSFPRYREITLVTLLRKAANYSQNPPDLAHNRLLHSCDLIFETMFQKYLNKPSGY